MVYILKKSILAVYGTWGPLGGCKILTQGVGIICPLAETFLENVFCEICPGYMCVCLFGLETVFVKTIMCLQV